jgi:hypothetical protein
VFLVGLATGRSVVCVVKSCGSSYFLKISSLQLHAAAPDTMHDGVGPGKPGSMVRYVALVVEIIDAVVAGVKVGGVISRLVDLLPLFIVIG